MANLIEYCHISHKSRNKKAVFDQIISNKLVRFPMKAADAVPGGRARSSRQQEGRDARRLPHQLGANPSPCMPASVRIAKPCLTLVVARRGRHDSVTVLE
jgi:hypothetical protein